MESIKEIYNIGSGPSSSHTMGPEKASIYIKNKYNADYYKVILYGSLALTGKGHLTDYIIKKTLINCDVLFDINTKKEHPNTMEFYIYKDNNLINKEIILSIGGSKIKLENELEEPLKPIYPHNTLTKIINYCKKNKLTLQDYVYKYEDNDIKIFLNNIYKEMLDSIKRGLRNKGYLPGQLKIKRKAYRFSKSNIESEPLISKERRKISAYAYAVSEENASGGRIVTAPTCGSAGILPAVLKYFQDFKNFSNDKIIDALAVSGLIGNIIKTNATISGAVAGCQAEVGSACAMAAAAHATLFDYPLKKVEYASEIAMEHHLGLTCDPVLGYVQIPCIERNAAGALRAVDSSTLAYFSSKQRISFDKVVETMYETGKDMQEAYKETSLSGLAKHFKETK